ncbi:hypothetical protein [Sphaerisporangium perillae]|uniref:hypothetical protein n=1 Tax=Sphaerisporangium perillae TaxID=2935860 RepID=UPI00200D4886|nr:hypothetical protein [Sphaerisporangium perillae]
MHALAPRFTEGTAGRATTAPGATGSHEARSRASGSGRLASARLRDEFLGVPVEIVDRCVEDVRACAAHLGLELTTAVVERIAREHLLALSSSAPLVDRAQAGPRRSETHRAAQR